MKAARTVLYLSLILLGAAGLIGWGITVGLPSAERLQVELGGETALTAALPEITAFLRTNQQDRTEFLHYDEGTERIRLSPYFDQLRSYHPDEQYILKVLSAMARNRDFQPRNYIYPPFYFYQIGAGLAAGRAVRAFSGSGDVLSFMRHPEAMAAVYLTARVTVAVLALAGILVLFFCGRLLGGNGTGITAALLLASVPLYLLAGKFIKPDIPCTLWSSCACFFSLLACRHDRWRDWLLAGASVGLAAGSKYPGVLSALLPAGYWAARYWPKPEVSWGQFLRDPGWRKGLLKLVGAGAACVLVFVIFNPSCLLDAATFRNDVGWISGVLRENGFFYCLFEFVFCLTADGLCYHTGILLLPLLAAGLIWAILRPRRELLPLVPVILAYIVMGSRGRPGSDAYLLPALPLGCLLAAMLVRTIPAAGWRRLTVGLAAVSGLVYAAAIDAAAARENIRLTASRWIQDNLPTGTVIGRRQYPVSYRTAMAPPQRYPATAELTSPDKAAGCDYFIASSFEWEWGYSPWRVRLEPVRILPADLPGYQLVKVFSEPPRVFGLIPMRQRGYVASPYLDVIFPVIAIYRKQGEAPYVQR